MEQDGQAPFRDLCKTIRRSILFKENPEVRTITGDQAKEEFDALVSYLCPSEHVEVNTRGE